MTRMRWRRGTAAQWTSADPILLDGEPGYETDTGKLKVGDGSTAWTSLAYYTAGGGAPTGAAGGVLDGTYPNPGLAAGVAGAGLAETSDVLSVNVDGSTIEVASDALRVKADGITANEIAAGAVGASELASTAVTPATYGDSTHVPVFVVDADGRITGVTNTAITGAGTGITDPGGSNDDFLQRKAGGWTFRTVAQVKTDLGLPAAAIGSTALVYRYTVTGTDKTSIDTGVDTANAGSNDWTNGDLLEVWIYVRTDNAVASDAVAITFNNDTSGVYYRTRLQTQNTTVSGAVQSAAANLAATIAGDSSAASVFGVVRLTCPNYMGTVAFKEGEMTNAANDHTAANMIGGLQGWEYASTNAISRLAITPTTGGKKLKVGTQLLIYKRLAS